MFGIEKFSINFAFGAFFFFLALVLLIAYAVYTYRYTVPLISRGKKITLVLLRTFALLLLLFILFEPVLSIARKEINRPVNLVFVDNSRSMTVNDGAARIENTENFLEEIKGSSLRDNTELFTFGDRISNISFDSLNPGYDEGVTNIAEIFRTVEESKRNISSIVIISDGQITEGSNPVYKATQLGIPVYSLGIGDSSARNDVQVSEVLYNEYIYSGAATVISAAILNSGFSGYRVSVTLSENGKTVDTKNITLETGGLQDVRFDYKPEQPGEKKMSVAVTEIEGEQNTDNNRKIFYINVLSSKIKVLIVSGAPSPDLSFIFNTLQKDENLSVSSITQIAPGKYLEKHNRERALDTADILYLIGFPTRQTDDAFLRRVSESISGKRKPFFLLMSDGLDINRLNALQTELPFAVKRPAEGYTEALPDVNTAELRNPLIYTGGAKTISDWNSLPPVFISNTDVTVKPETDILATAKIRNIPVNKPLILTRKLGSRKSVAVLGKDIWRWKLQTATKNIDVFDNFIINSVKWLNTGEDQKQVVIKTSKKIYSRGETVQFTAQVYDAAFNPVPDAKVDIKIQSENETANLTLDPAGNGLYEGEFETNKTGDYKFSGSASVDNNTIGRDEGTFNIGEIDTEMLNTRMNFQLLSLLSTETRGEFFLPEQQEQLLDILKQRTERTSDTRIITSEISLWSNEWFLVIIVLLFAFEWFLRKQSGML